MMEAVRASKARKARTNHRVAFEHIRAEILSGRASPGAKINIVAWAQEMGVSAGAVREALATLESEALVISEAQRGYSVSPVSAGELLHLTTARIEVEKLCLAESISHGDLAWEGLLVAAFHRLGRVSERDPQHPELLSAEWTEAHSDFHTSLVAGCPNIWLRRMHATLYQQSERYRQRSAPLSAAQRDIHGEHKALLEAMLARNVSLACELISNHLATTADWLLASLDAKSADALHTAGASNARARLDSIPKDSREDMSARD